MPPSGMKEKKVCPGAVGESMPVPTGRFEKRIARVVTVEIRPEDEECLKPGR